MDKPSIFISYSHKDKEWEEKFRPHLKMLEKLGNLVFWDDRMIKPGQEWYDRIKKEMAKAAVSVCFISADYLASDFVLKEEIPFLLERQKEKGMEIIPVLLRPCLWKAVRWLKKLQMLPGEGKSISVEYKEDYDIIFTSIANRIFEIIDDPNYSTPVPDILYSPPEKIDINRLPDTGSKLFGREKELRQLDTAWKSETTNIISFIAWGGMGKSSLVNKWLEYMKEENFLDAQRVFAWSFYSQGTNERDTSADLFISKALEWFGDSNPLEGSARDKGLRLAKLIEEKKTILILDGLEPLQSSHKFEKGNIKDQALSTLLISLAKRNNGLCIITSREDIADLEKYKDKAPQINLEKISKEAGRALLRVGGVNGTDNELENAVEQFGNHALAVKLIPVYLQNIKDHHISDVFKIPDLDIPEEMGRHPRRIIEEISKNLNNRPEQDILKMLGFFDRPADTEAIGKIKENPVIKGITDTIVNCDEAGFLRALHNLRKLKLLAQESKHRPNTLDCHPLIREHFGEKLKKENPEAWKEAHARLYEYYKNKPKKELPDNLEEMEPLFAAVMHGCLAGKHQEVRDDVFYNRIYRKNDYYIGHKLGALGADLSCLSNFFESLWDKPVPDLTEADKAVVLNWAGFALRAVGRLSEAAQPMKADLKAAVEQDDIKGAAIAANNLSELYLTLGEVANAEQYGEQSDTFADRSGDDVEMVEERTTLADAKHQAEKISEAEKLFIEAENMQKKSQPEYPYLYSLSGFQFCDLLLSMGKYQEVLERARKTIKWVRNLLSIALDKLTIGKALMLQAVDKSSGFSEAQDYLNQAVDGLREAGTQHRLPWALLARATLYKHKKEFLKSWIDLDEAREIAEYGQMRLHLTDYHLEAARVIKAQLNHEKTKDDFTVVEDGIEKKVSKEEMNRLFKEHVAKAGELIEETGYHRRDGELEELKS